MLEILRRPKTDMRITQFELANYYITYDITTGR